MSHKNKDCEENFCKNNECGRCSNLQQLPFDQKTNKNWTFVWLAIKWTFVELVIKITRSGIQLAWSQWWNYKIGSIYWTSMVLTPWKGILNWLCKEYAWWFRYLLSFNILLCEIHSKFAGNTLNIPNHKNCFAISFAFISLKKIN